MHWPKVSEKKKLELETLKMSLKTSPHNLTKSPKSKMESRNGDTISAKTVPQHNRASSE